MKKEKLLFSIFTFFVFLSFLALANTLGQNSLGSKAITADGVFVGLVDDFSKIKSDNPVNGKDNMFSKKIGVVTIGQTPRPDIISLAKKVLGQDYKVVLAGALDDLTFEKIPKFEPEEYILIAGIRDRAGKRKSVRVTREFLVPLIQKRIVQLEKENVNIIIIWCAGRFPVFKSEAIIIRPSEILKGVVNAVFKKGRLGVVYPGKEQLIWAKPEWSKEGIMVYADTPGRSKSRNEEEKLLAERLAEKDLDLILLNCAGFGSKIKKIIQEKTGKPVIQTNSLALRVVKELVF